MAAFLVNKRSCSACSYRHISHKISDYGHPRNGAPRLKGSALDGAKIKKSMSKDTVGEIMNPGALNKKWRKNKDHSMDNKRLVKALSTARLNKSLERRTSEEEKKLRESFNMPRFVAVPSSKLVPNTARREDEVRAYKEQRDQEIRRGNALKMRQQHAAAAKRAAAVGRRNQVVQDLIVISQGVTITKEVILGRTRMSIPVKKIPKQQAYAAPSTKGPQGPEYAVRGRADAKLPERPQTAPVGKAKRIRDYRNVPHWWADQAGPWELLHVGERGC
jgi:hypothetical protein